MFYFFVCLLHGHSTSLIKGSLKKKLIIPVTSSSGLVSVKECCYRSQFHTWSVVAFLGLMPLEQIFDWGGEQMALYLGKEIGDLLIVTLNK